MGLTSYLTGKGIGVEGYKLKTFFTRALGQSSCISRARQFFVDEMIAGEYTHWLSLDDDMSFPMDIVDKLIVHNKDIICLNARHKTQEVKGSLIGLDGNHVDSTLQYGLEEIHTFGGAIFLAKVGAFKHIPKPHFQVIWSEQHNDYVSEDIYFSALLRASGLTFWCDHTTSHEIGHIGDFTYTF